VASTEAPARPVQDYARLAAVVWVLAAAELTAHFTSGTVSHLAVPVGVLAALVVAVAGRGGLSARELGLARDTWGRGARWGAALALVVTLVVVLVAVIPATRDVFLDDRYDNGAGEALLTGLVLVPLQTVLPEELAFRGVVLGLLLRRLGARWAVVASSVLFGLWHVTSAIGLTDENQAVGDHLGRGLAGDLAGIGGAVLATAAAGVVLCWLRLRTGSLLAPVGLHWAVNGVAVLVSALVWATV